MSAAGERMMRRVGLKPQPPAALLEYRPCVRILCVL